jgi:hypothetical protein
MQRSTIDKLISTTALLIAIVLLLGSIGLFFANHFIHGQVTSQLQSEKITFPGKDSTALNALPEADRNVVEKYAGQQVLTGAQAEVFADHYIAVHLIAIGGGKTYSELSEASIADPTNVALAGKVNTVFKGQTLRGMLLNAYAFDTMATVALLAAWGALTAGCVLTLLAMLGFSHAKKTKKK